MNYEVAKKQLGAIVNELAERYSKVQVAASLDALKEAGFHHATRSGVTISVDDVATPPRKREILEGYEAKAEKVQKQYERGLITDDERRQELIEIWTQASAEVAKAMEDNFSDKNSVYFMVTSGARGNMMQIRQIAGMRGLVANPKGEIIPRPIKNNYREGLTVLEYFISTHGARKGLADTALRTADSGYLTRRLVDVSQDVIVREDDCGSDRGLTLPIAEKGADGVLRKAENAETSVYARTLVEDVVIDGDVVVAANVDIGDAEIEALVSRGVETVRVRSVLTCDSKVGTCAKCYGRSLAAGKLVDIGEAVGIVAAQSIGEPGTQLTMRTFHTGGVAGEDITHGLPRVVELFEARRPKGLAPITESAGRVQIEDGEKTRKITIIPDDGSEEQSHQVSRRVRLLVEDGQHVEVGQQLVVGAQDPHEVLRILGQRAVQKHLVDEVQEVYRSQGVSIHDKHIEIIVRQMLRRITVIESGRQQLAAGRAGRAQPVRDREPSSGCREWRGGLWPSGAHGHHEGVARDRLVAVGGLLPGDHPRPHRGGHAREERPAARAQGERDPGQADPGRHGPVPLPRHQGRADRGGEGSHVLHGRLHRARLRRLRDRLRRLGAARGVRLPLLIRPRLDPSREGGAGTGHPVPAPPVRPRQVSRLEHRLRSCRELWRTACRRSRAMAPP